jgi:hypothetical protein
MRALSRYNTSPAPPRSIVLPAINGRITDDCLRRGGLLLVCAFGGELENSHIGEIPRGTDVFMCENLAFSSDEVRKEIERALTARTITLIPGQILTLGGAAISRYEAFHRRNHENVRFEKAQGRAFVAAVTHHILQMLKEQMSKERGLYDSMYGIIRESAPQLLQHRLPG